MTEAFLKSLNTIIHKNKARTSFNEHGRQSHQVSVDVPVSECSPVMNFVFCFLIRMEGMEEGCMVWKGGGGMKFDRVKWYAEKRWGGTQKGGGVCKRGGESTIRWKEGGV